MPDNHTDAAVNHRGRRRMRLMVALAAVFVAIAIAYGVYWSLVARYSISADDAYVTGNQVALMSQVSGTVTAVNVNDTDRVHRGEVLVTMDPLSLRGLPGNEIANASGLFNFLKQLALGFGTSISITLWDKRASFHDHRLSTHVSAYSHTTQHWLAELHQLGLSLGQIHERLAELISGQAFMLATNDIFWGSTWIFLLLSGLVWLSRPGSGRPQRA